MYSVYKITNVANGKIYVGCTSKNIYDRFGWHWRQRNNKTLIAKALRKYGKNGFRIETLEEVDTREQMFLREKCWISELSSNNRSVGYNLTDGGDSGPIRYGAAHAMFGKKQPHLSHLNKLRKGIKLSESHREKVRIAGIGRKMSIDTLKQMASTRKKAWSKKDSPYKRPEYIDKLKAACSTRVGRAKSKPVECIESGIVYSSIADAAKSNGILRPNLSAFLLGKSRSKRLNGLTFRISTL